MIYINSNDGAKIAVYDLCPSTYEKTIVLVHGWPLSHRMFDYLSPVLLQEGYRVISMDIRGFGMSDDTTSGYSYDQLATDLYYVVKSLNLTCFDLLGFSMGGAIVCRYMSLCNGYGVSKLCLLDAAVPSYCKTRENPYGNSIQDTNKLIQLGKSDRPSLNQYFGSIFFAQKHSDAFMNWMQNISDGASQNGEMQTLVSLRNENVYQDLKYIKVPTAIFHGRQDQICSFKMAELTHSYIRRSKLFPLDNAGHGAFIDAMEQFHTQLLYFLNGRQ